MTLPTDSPLDRIRAVLHAPEHQHRGGVVIRREDVDWLLSMMEEMAETIGELRSALVKADDERDTAKVALDGYRRALNGYREQSHRAEAGRREVRSGTPPSVPDVRPAHAKDRLVTFDAITFTLESVETLRRERDDLRAVLIRVATRDVRCNQGGATAWDASGVLFPGASFAERDKWIKSLR
jgi:hypothetical protein